MYGASLNLDLVDKIDEAVTKQQEDELDDEGRELAPPPSNITTSRGRIESGRDAKRRRRDVPRRGQTCRHHWFDALTLGWWHDLLRTLDTLHLRLVNVIRS